MVISIQKNEAEPLCMKLLETNLRPKLRDIEFDNDFLNMTPDVQMTKQKLTNETLSH